MLIISIWLGTAKANARGNCHDDSLAYVIEIPPDDSNETDNEIGDIGVKIKNTVKDKVLQELDVSKLGLEICTVCLENMSGNIKILKSCKHKYHSKCLDKWLEKKNSCPICRQIVR